MLYVVLMTIKISHDGSNRITIKPAGFLGDSFKAYLAACRTFGAEFDRDRNCNVASLSVLTEAIAQLRAAGFQPALDATLAQRLNATVAAAQSSRDAATARANQIDAALRARGQSLYPFQRNGVAWLSQRTAALLADDMGLGKTVQAIASLPDGEPVLVVCPASLKGVWLRELKKWRPSLRVTVLDGEGSFVWPTAGEVVVVNYDILPESLQEQIDAVDKLHQRLVGVVEAQFVSMAARDAAIEETYLYRDAVVGNITRAYAPFAAACPNNLTIIADEAHLLKNQKSLRNRRFRALTSLAAPRGGRGWLLTATPVQNRMPELASILQAVPGLFEEAYGTFGNFFQLCNAERGRFGTVWGEPKPEVAERLQRVCLRRLKKDVLAQLPSKTYKDVYVDLDRKTLKVCDELLEECNRLGINIMGALEHADLTRLSKLSFKLVAKVRAALATAKMAALDEILDTFEDAAEPVVVFSAHRAPIDLLGQREGWAAITGSTPPAERTAIEERFQRGELKGIAGTIDAMGVGLTLTHASNVVFVDLEWNPSLNEQAEDRCNRIGQTRGVVIIRLIGNHAMDTRITDLLSCKTAIIDASVEAAAVHGDDAHIETVVDSLQAVLAATPVAQAVTPAQTSSRFTVATSEAEKADLELLRGRSAVLSSFGRDLVAKHDRNPGLSPKQWEWVHRLADEQREKLAAAEREAERKAQEKATREQRARDDARARGQASARSERARAARSVQEAWAGQALVTLNALNPDGARFQNGEGFNRPDSAHGMMLAFAAEAGAMTDEMWTEAIEMCKKYHRQIGRCPE